MHVINAAGKMHFSGADCMLVHEANAVGLIEGLDEWWEKPKVVTQGDRRGEVLRAKADAWMQYQHSTSAALDLSAYVGNASQLFLNVALEMPLVVISALVDCCFSPCKLRVLAFCSALCNAVLADRLHHGCAGTAKQQEEQRKTKRPA